MILPIDILLYGIVPYIEDDKTLVNFRACSRQTRSFVRLHEYPTCVVCGSSRFGVGPRRMCYVEGCMCRTSYHPIIPYDGPVCGWGCLMKRRRRASSSSLANGTSL